MQFAQKRVIPLVTPVTPIARWNYLNILFFIFMASLNFEMVNIAGGEGNGLSIARILFPLYLVAFVLDRRFRLSGKALALGGLVFLILYFAASSSISNFDGRYDRITDLSTIFCVILFIIAISHQETYKDLIYDGLLYFSFGATVLALLSLLGFGAEYDADGRLTIFGDNSNIVGLRMSIACSVFAFLILHGGRGVLFCAGLGAASLVAFSVMITTGSRVAFVSLCAALLILFCSNVHSVKVLFLRVIALTAASYGIFWYLFQTDNVLLDRLVRSYVERHTAGRESVWQMYVDSFLSRDNFIFGLGFSGFDDLSSQLFGRNLSPHNVFLEVTLLSGFAGLALFLIFNVKALATAVRLARQSHFVLPLMLLSQYFAAVMTAQTLNNKIMWLILALCFIPLVPVSRMSAVAKAEDLGGR